MPKFIDWTPELVEHPPEALDRSLDFDSDSQKWIGDVAEALDALPFESGCRVRSFD